MWEWTKSRKTKVKRNTKIDWMLVYSMESGASALGKELLSNDLN